MKKVVVVGCGKYMEDGYGCPGDWRCLRAAALGEGEFDEEVQVIGLVRCACPGRTTVTNTALTIAGAQIKPDRIYLSTCMVKPKPDCPYVSPDQLAEMLKAKTGVEVVKGTHDYH